MKQFDQTKLDVAIKYVERIADGCNPVNNVPLHSMIVMIGGIVCLTYSKEKRKKTN